MGTVTKGFDARLANRPLLVFDFRALWRSISALNPRISASSYFGKTELSGLKLGAYYLRSAV